MCACGEYFLSRLTRPRCLQEKFNVGCLYFCNGSWSPSSNYCPWNRLWQTTSYWPTIAFATIHLQVLIRSVSEKLSIYFCFRTCHLFLPICSLVVGQTHHESHRHHTLKHRRLKKNTLWEGIWKENHSHITFLLPGPETNIAPEDVSGQIRIIPKPELRGFGIWRGFSTKTTIWGDQPAVKGSYNLPRCMVRRRFFSFLVLLLNLAFSIRECSISVYESMSCSALKKRVVMLKTLY